MRLPLWFHRLGSPPYVYGLAGRLKPWLGWSALVLILAGAYGGLVLAPPDYQQGDSYRIIFIHVPSAYIGMMAYVILAFSAGIGFVWRMKLAHAVAVAAAPIGASFNFLALVTGAIWGKPTWGTFWQWGDPRIMFELLSLFLYLGYLSLRAAFEDRDKADRVSAVLAVVGVVNIPIIHFSVIWWNSLHQGPTLLKLGAPSIATAMLIPLLTMITGFTVCFVWLLLQRLQAEIIDREQETRWIRRLAAETGS